MNNKEFPNVLIPYFRYIPDISFDRMRNQKGSFICQLKLGENVQPIHYKYKMYIKNKIAILRELDKLGINRQFIYSDNDSVAKYIKESN